MVEGLNAREDDQVQLELVTTLLHGVWCVVHTVVYRTPSGSRNPGLDP